MSKYLLVPFPDEILRHEIVPHLEYPWRCLLWCALMGRNRIYSANFDKYIELIGAEGEVITKKLLNLGFLSRSSYRHYALIYGWDHIDPINLYPLSDMELIYAAYGPHDIQQLYKKSLKRLRKNKDEQVLWEICKILILTGKRPQLTSMVPSAGISIKSDYKKISFNSSMLVRSAISTARLDIAQHFMQLDPNQIGVIERSEMVDLFWSPMKFINMGYLKSPEINEFYIPENFKRLTSIHTQEFDDRFLACLNRMHVLDTKPIHRYVLSTRHPFAIGWMIKHGYVTELVANDFVTYGSDDRVNMILRELYKTYDLRMSLLSRIHYYNTTINKILDPTIFELNIDDSLKQSYSRWSGLPMPGSEIDEET